jgi:predicted cation transporter
MLAPNLVHKSDIFYVIIRFELLMKLIWSFLAGLTKQKFYLYSISNSFSSLQYPATLTASYQGPLLLKQVLKHPLLNVILNSLMLSYNLFYDNKSNEKTVPFLLSIHSHPAS